jgi:acyl-CoA reductase-like NAD-dependent aldehyde dehydrogenase
MARARPGAVTHRRAEGVDDHRCGLGTEDVARACASARAAFEDGRWSRLAPAARKAVLHRLADLIEKHAVELAVLGVRDNGPRFPWH